jgi:hypothetical protein
MIQIGKIYISLSNSVIYNQVNLIFNQFKSLSGKILSFKKEKMLELDLPTFYNLFEFTSFGANYYILWKINIKKVSSDCMLKFVVVQGEKVSFIKKILVFCIL